MNTIDFTNSQVENTAHGNTSDTTSVHENDEGNLVLHPHPKKVDGKVQCLECGQMFGTLTRHLSSAHSMTAAEYKAKHGQDVKIVPDGFRSSRKASETKKPSMSSARTDGKTELPLRNFPKAAEDSFAAAEKGRELLKARSLKLTHTRYETAGHIARFIHEMQDVKEIRTYVEERGVKWPEAQCKLPAEQALVLHDIFPDDEDVSPTRVSEWSKVIRVLTVNKAFGKAAISFIEEHRGVKGIYADFDNDGKPRLAKKDGKGGSRSMTDEEVEELLAAAKGRVKRAFPLIVGQYSAALVRIDQEHPERVKIVDALDIGEKVFRCAMEKLAKIYKATNIARKA